MHGTTLHILSDFTIWFLLGLEHIADLNAYDHILFLVALCSVYQLAQWKKLLVLVTAFTIGHCITLALSTFQVINIPSAIIELLIPITIIITAGFNLKRVGQEIIVVKPVQYLMALFFGLIHGLGFSYLLRSLLGKTASIVQPLFAFNVGLEAGQIIIILCILFITMFIDKLFPTHLRNRKIVFLLAAIAVALTMCVERGVYLLN